MCGFGQRLIFKGVFSAKVVGPMFKGKGFSIQSAHPLPNFGRVPLPRSDRFPASKIHVFCPF